MRKLVKKEPLVLTRQVEEVALIPDASSGLNEFDVTQFKPDKAYKVFGATYITYEDGSGVMCWLVQDERGVVSPKAMDKFRVVK